MSSFGDRRGRRGGSAGDAPPEVLDPADAEELARTILLDRLSERPRSRAELATAMARRGVPDDVAGGVLDRFAELGMVDDETFAQSWVDSRRRTKGLAGRALAQELRQKGIDDEIARDAIDAIDPDDERERARELVRKRLRSLRGLDEATTARRVVSMLARKGYSPSVAYAVVRDEMALDLVDPEHDT